jgi:mycoredoxin
MKNLFLLLLIVLCGYLGYQRFLGGDTCPLPSSSNEQISNGVNIYPGASNSSELTSNEVILYTTSWCQNCKMTKAFLENRGQKYVNYDIEKSKEGRERHEILVRPFRKNGQVGVPLIVVNGKVIYGFSESQILAALK